MGRKPLKFLYMIPRLRIRIMAITSDFDSDNLCSIHRSATILKP